MAQAHPRCAGLLLPRLRQPGRRVAHDGSHGPLCGVRGSVSLNVALCEHHPEIIAACVERGWEFYSHGTYNTRYVFDMTPDQERELIRDSIDTIKNTPAKSSMDGCRPRCLTPTRP